MSFPSGKFVLRLPPPLHLRLRAEAESTGTSLNQLILRRLQGANFGVSSIAFFDALVEKLQDVYSGSVCSLIQFGSTIRGEQRDSSDLDLLIVMKPDVEIDRTMYRKWDALVAPSFDSRISPQFSHLPRESAPSSLWLEVALEGVILYAENEAVSQKLFKLRKRIASGEFVRKLSHGHPYWVHETPKE